MSFGIDFKWVVDNLRLFDVMAAYWDEEVQKSETVDRVGGRIWSTKSHLLSRKIVCGAVKGWNDR